jgi:hypothetical protein
MVAELYSVPLDGDHVPISMVAELYSVPLDEDHVPISMVAELYSVPLDIVNEWIHLGYLKTWTDPSGSGNVLCSAAALQMVISNPPRISVRDLAWLWAILPTQVIRWEQTGMLKTLWRDGDLFIYPSWDLQTRMEEFARLHIPEQIYFTRLSNATYVQKIAGWLTTDEVSQQLQVQPTVVYLSYAENIVTPVAHCRSVIYFDRGSLQTLAYHLEQKSPETPKASKGILRRERRRN